MSMLTDVQAVKGRFHWGNSTAWRMPGGGAQVRAYFTLAGLTIVHQPCKIQSILRISCGLLSANGQHAGALGCIPSLS